MKSSSSRIKCHQCSPKIYPVCSGSVISLYFFKKAVASHCMVTSLPSVLR